MAVVPRIKRRRRWPWREHIETRTFNPDPELDNAAPPSPTSMLRNTVAAFIIGICVLLLLAGVAILIIE